MSDFGKQLHLSYIENDIYTSYEHPEGIVDAYLEESDNTVALFLVEEPYQDYVECKSIVCTKEEFDAFYLNDVVPDDQQVKPFFKKVQGRTMETNQKDFTEAVNGLQYEYNSLDIYRILDGLKALYSQESVRFWEKYDTSVSHTLTSSIGYIQTISDVLDSVDRQEAFKFLDLLSRYFYAKHNMEELCSITSADGLYFFKD